MTYKDFPLWLEGVFDANYDGLDIEQMEVIREKMKTLTFPAADTSINNFVIKNSTPRC